MSQLVLTVTAWYVYAVLLVHKVCLLVAVVCTKIAYHVGSDETVEECQTFWDEMIDEYVADGEVVVQYKCYVCDHEWYGKGEYCPRCGNVRFVFRSGVKTI